MPSSPELLRYFVAEAGECLDILEPLVAGAIGPVEGSSVVSAARALRGTATIARVARIADLAFAIEQVGGALRDSELGWTQMVGETLRRAVSELRGLVGSAPNWGDTENARMAAVEASVRRFVPNVGRPTPPMPSSTTQPVFVALQASAIASDLEALIQAADRRRVLDELLSRVRIMLGVAGLQEYPPLAEVCDAIERAARGTLPDAPLTEGETELFSSAAALLRRSSDELRARVSPDRNSAEIRRFAEAVTDVEPTAEAQERVVQIEELFYYDGGPHLLTRSSAPPVTPERRFSDEVVSRAEHVRRLIADARLAGDGIARRRIRRDLTATLHALETTAQSFGAAQVAALCGDAARRSELLSPLELDALDAAAALLLSPAHSIDELERRVAVLTRRQNTPSAGVRVATPSAGSRVTPLTPTGRALQDLLANGIAGLRGLDDQPFVERESTPTDDDVVPVESLFYRGRAALLRAIQVRDAMRAQGTPDAESLRELYDLLDLARTE
jgi:HPt (histidine-containing phosphotransfer) domain-containing protein